MKLTKSIFTLMLIISFIIKANINNIKVSKSSKEQKNSQSEIFDTETAITFTKNLAKIILDVPTVPQKTREFNEHFEKCFSGFNEKPIEYTPILKSFYLKCLEIKDDVAQKWNTNIFHTTIMTKLATVRISQSGQDSTCQVALPYSSNPDMDKLDHLFKAYFQNFVKKNKLAQPFITSMYSVHRDSLPDFSYIKVNMESRADTSNMYPKIQKSSFTDSDNTGKLTRVTNANDKMHGSAPTK